MTEGPTTFQYAWVDADPTSQSLVPSSTWWWSQQYTAAGIVKHLGHVISSQSLQLYIKHGEDDLLIQCSSVAAACTWLQEAFSQEIRSGQEEQQPARSSSLGSVLFGVCSQPSVAEDFVPESGPDESPLAGAEAAETSTRLHDLGDCLTHDETSKLQFMHGDLYSQLARHNPWRWSSLRSPEQAAKELDEQPRARKVLLRLASSTQRLQKMFPSPASAAVWIRRRLVNSSDPALDEERLCVICLTQPRNVLLMPCRHAVLCEECLEIIMQRRPSECPICRRRIQNHARGRFMDDYVELVLAAEARMELSQLQAYEGMYNHIRPLMVTGALLASGAAACFVIAPPLAPAVAPALLTGATVVGYLPWLATTVAHFESEDMADSTLQNRIFSQEDFSSPLKLVTKSAVLLVAAPVAGVVFFLPYGIYAGVLRPLTRLTLQGLVRAACLTHVYVLRPAASMAATVWEFLSGTGSAFGDGFMAFLKSLYDMVLCPLGSGLKWLGQRLVDVAQWTYRSLMVPAWNATCWFAEAAYENVLLPSAQAAWNAIQAAAQAAYTYVLAPSGRALAAMAEQLGGVLTVCAEGLYAYIVLPTGQAAWAGLKALCHGLGAAAHGTYEHMLVPVASALASALKAFGHCLGSSAEALYGYVLQPLGSGISACVLAPAALAARAVAGALWHGAGMAVYAVGQLAQVGYAYVLVPVGHGIRATGTALWYASGAVAAALVQFAQVGYSTVIRPCANAIIAVAEGTYTTVLRPCGQALAAAAQSVGHAVLAIAQVSGHVVYAYVVCPVGQASQAALLAAREAVQQCHATARSTGQTVRVTIQSLVRR